MSRGAFTLAEVLITLGIIGIVAAMTMPALIQNYKKHEYSIKLKKFTSLMQQAILLSENDNGPAGDWLKEGGIQGDIKNEDNETDFDANSSVIEALFNKYFAPYLKHSAFETGNSEWAYGEAKVVLADGSHLYLHNGNCIDLNIDLNGDKGSNQYGIDTFVFYLCSNEKCAVHTWANCGKLTPHMIRPASRASALTNCKNSPKTCASLLIMDNWEFKDDYPYNVK